MELEECETESADDCRFGGCLNCKRMVVEFWWLIMPVDRVVLDAGRQGRDLGCKLLVCKPLLSVCCACLYLSVGG